MSQRLMTIYDAAGILTAKRDDRHFSGLVTAKPNDPGVHAPSFSYYTGALGGQVGATQRPGIIAQLSSYHLYLSRWNECKPPP